MTAFYVLGGVLAAWALIVTALGVTRHDFPGSGGGERIVAAISVVLVAGAIGSGIVTAANEEEEEPAEAAETAEPAREQPAGEAPPAGGPALTADPGGALSFDTDTLEAEAGEVTITMDNPSSNPHNIAIQGQGVDEEGEVVTEAESRVSARLEPGDYTFYCSVPGHRQGGMEGTLTVR